LIFFEDKTRFGDWGLGIGDWGLGPIPNPQSPIPNPQSPIYNLLVLIHFFFFKKNQKLIF
jgi:hypothetical protein